MIRIRDFAAGAAVAALLATGTAVVAQGGQGDGHPESAGPGVEAFLEEGQHFVRVIGQGGEDDRDGLRAGLARTL